METIAHQRGRDGNYEIVGVVAHPFNFNAQEAEVGRSLYV